MSSFADSVKFLDRVPARVASDAELEAASRLPDPLKYTKREKTRKIKKIPYVFYIADQLYPALNSGNRGFVLFQLGYSFPEDFHIISLPKFLDQDDQQINCDLFIRYRIGTDVYRYHIGDLVGMFNPLGSLLPYNKQFVPQYNGQLIKKNFVMECFVIYDGAGQVGFSSAGAGSAPFDYTTNGL